MSTKKPIVGIVMGSDSDWSTMEAAAQVLEQFAVPFEAQVLSAHRMPDALFSYAEQAQPRGLRAIIAGAGGAAHLPGMLAAKPLYQFVVCLYLVNIYAVKILCIPSYKCLKAYRLQLLLLVRLAQQTQLYM